MNSLASKHTATELSCRDVRVRSCNLGCGFCSAPSKNGATQALTCIEFVPRDKMASMYGEVVWCFYFLLFGQGATISLAQIILGSDYSGSLKELQ